MLSRKIVAGEREMLVQVYVKRGCLVPLHAHESEQMTYVLQGALQVSRGRRGDHRARGRGAAHSVGRRASGRSARGHVRARCLQPDPAGVADRSRRPICSNRRRALARRSQTERRWRSIVREPDSRSFACASACSFSSRGSASCGGSSNPSILAGRLAGWLADPSAGSLSHWYLRARRHPGHGRVRARSCRSANCGRRRAPHGRVDAGGRVPGVPDGAEHPRRERRAVQVRVPDEPVRPAGARADAWTGDWWRAAAVEPSGRN